MRETRTDLTKLLVRDGMRRATVAADDLHEMGTSCRGSALSFMGWANALADREEEADKVHSPTVGGGFRPMRIRGKSAEAEAPASNQPWREAGDPSMARSHPVLTLVSSRQRVARRNTSATPCLVLIMGGLSLDHDGTPGPTRR